MASTAAVTGGSAVIAVGGAPAAHAATTEGPQVPPVNVVQEITAIKIHKAVKVNSTVTVVSGDTLSGISQVHCGTPRDWPGIFNANRGKIKDPNLIYPRQVLTLDCTTAHITALAPKDPPKDPPRVIHSAGKIWGVSFGFPNHCGDGDGDGWDVKCHTVSVASDGDGGAVVVAAASSSGGSFQSSGTYSFSALEALWVAAGGPGWAEAAAARVAECESGGDPSAHNPSGATGLWQILGQVVGGNLDNPYTNALNAVSKFKASGDTWAQWVCKP